MLPFAGMLLSATPQLTTRAWTGARGFQIWHLEKNEYLRA